MQRIGIYGGAFNPPHLGHVHAAQYVVQALNLDKLLLIPSGTSPHKPLPAGSPTAQQRLEMVGLWAGEKMQVCDLEIARGGTSYTYETVQQLKAQYPQDELILCMGTDMFLSFHSWKEPQLILQNVSLAVFYRGDKGEIADIAARKAEYEAAGHNIYLVENPVLEISSTQLRRMLVFGCAAPFLHEDVAKYIEENGLYGIGENYKNLPIDQLEKVVVNLLNPNRVKHVLGCRDTAAEMARTWGVSETDAARAGLLHDITKALDGPLQLTLCREYGKVLDEFSENNPKTLHALTGSMVAERIFGENEAVVAAIESHTTGKPAMNTLEKIIYVADYMEPNRDFPGVEELRRLAYTDLDGALKLGLEMTLAVLREQKRQISPASSQALAYLTKGK